MGIFRYITITIFSIVNIIMMKYAGFETVVLVNLASILTAIIFKDY